jgi:hypothetical protein
MPIRIRTLALKCGNAKYLPVVRAAGLSSFIEGPLVIRIRKPPLRKGAAKRATSRKRR